MVSCASCWLVDSIWFHFDSSCKHFKQLAWLFLATIDAELLENWTPVKKLGDSSPLLSNLVMHVFLQCWIWSRTTIQKYWAISLSLLKLGTFYNSLWKDSPSLSLSCHCVILYDCFSTCIIWTRPLYLLRHVRIRESSPFTKTVVYNQPENVRSVREYREGVFQRCWSKWRYVHGEAKRVSKVFVTRSRASH